MQGAGAGELEQGCRLKGAGARVQGAGGQVAGDVHVITCLQGRFAVCLATHECSLKLQIQCFDLGALPLGYKILCYDTSGT